MRRHAPAALFVVAAAAATLAAPRAQAAPEFVYRSLTLPRGDVALDLGLGYGHAPLDANHSADGFGMNLEIAGGVTHDLELGFRTGVRFDDGGQATRADLYGRPFETEDRYGTGTDRVANPELRMTWTVARGAIPQIGLEVRAYLPFENNTRFGIMFGVPLALRLGAVRIDTGVFVPVIFTEPTTTSAVSIPLHLWIQATPTFWLGPLLGLRFESPGSHTAYPLGFGLGSALSRQIDLRAWFLFPDMNAPETPARTFGLGVGLQIRFE
ncbi:MAG TPA: hypothetical protein VH560_07505 [Polyangia bacterium]|jgi:hypothetical protein|nr:hypothetical protein [Polyangia bacterium]